MAIIAVIGIVMLISCCSLFLVENLKILAHRPRGPLPVGQGIGLAARHPVDLIDIRPDMAGIQGKRHAAHKPLLDAGADHAFEQPPQHIRVPEPFVARA